MSAVIQERPYPEHLYKNEGPFTRAQLACLANSRVAVAGLGAFGLGAVGLAQLGVGTGPRGWLRLADPDIFERHNANRQALAGGGRLGQNKTAAVAAEIRGLVPQARLQTFEDGLTPENLDRFLASADLILDIVDYLRPEVKVELHRRARRAGLPVIAGLLVERGAIGYAFEPAGMSFDEFFGVPDDPGLLASWSLPLSRIVVLPQPRARQRLYFDVVNGRHPIPSNALSATATHLLLNHLAVSRLLSQPIPTIPTVAYLDPDSWTMGSLDLGPAVAAQSSSPWTALAPAYDRLMELPCESLFARLLRDLAGCSRILEAGCGTGLLCERLARQGHEVVGLDRNLAMLARAAGRARQHGFLLGEGDVESLFFEDASFDGYASLNVVVDASLTRTLAEAWRVLRPGGRLALSSFTAPPDLTALPPELAEPARAVHAGRTYAPLEKVVREVRAAGFEPLHTDDGFLAGSYYLVARR